MIGSQKWNSLAHLLVYVVSCFGDTFKFIKFGKILGWVGGTSLSMWCIILAIITTHANNAAAAARMMVLIYKSTMIMSVDILAEREA